MSKKKNTKKQDNKVKTNSELYMLELENTLIIGGRAFAPGIHNIDKQDYDVMKGSKNPRIKAYIKK